jgi:hypothetical protein
MTSVHDCLAIFSVSALANDDMAVARACAAIDAFVAERSNEPEGLQCALRHLRSAFMDLRLDSSAASEILADLDRRVGAYHPKRPHMVEGCEPWI